MSETIDTPVETYSPSINADEDTLRAIYHIARSGVEIEYAGISGRTLALLAATDLYEMGHEDAKDWMIDINWQRYEAANLEENQTEIVAAVDAFMSANELWRLGADIALEDVVVAANRAVDAEVFESQLHGLPPRAATAHEIGYKSELLYTLTYLRDLGVNELDDDIQRGIVGLLASINRGVAGSGELGMGYRSLQGLHAELFEQLNDNEIDALEQEILPTLALIAESFKYAKTIDAHSAAVNAAIDLYQYNPNSRYYKRLYKQRQREVMAHSISRKREGCSYLDSQTQQRLMEGSIIDVHTMAWLVRNSIAVR